MNTRIVALEEHCLTGALISAPSFAATLKPVKAFFPQKLLHTTSEIGPQRIASMDDSHISLQVLSHAPCGSSSDNTALCAANNELCVKAGAYPGRFAAFGTIPMSDPPAAAAELTRCVKELGFVGAMIDNHLDDGTFYDDPRFWTVFQTAQDLDVPIYIHPCFAPKDIRERMYTGNFSELMGFVLETSGWGFHANTGLHVLRLWAAGLFDAFPKLKIIIGHMGEMLPYMLDRVVERTQPAMRDGQKGFKQVWNENIWLTTAGLFSLDPMACLLRNTRKDHIMFSVDYPYATNERGYEFLQLLQESDMVNDEEFEMIAYRNAEELLKLKEI